MKYKYNYNRSKNKKSNVKHILLVCTIIIVTLLISLFIFRNNKIIAKINNVILKPFEIVSNLKPAEKISSFFTSKKALQAQNLKLIGENNELSLKMLEYQKLIKENESLRKLLEIKTTFQHYKLAPAQIIIRSHENYMATFVINVGLKDGVKVNQAVVHKEGLVGYISSVTENTSTVVTILDPKTSVSVIIPTINNPAILTGNIEMKSNNTLKLESIQIGAELSIGDMIYTSGLGEMYPNAIPVAKIYSLHSKKTDSQRYAICEPLVDISTINEVSVIIGEE